MTKIVKWLWRLGTLGIMGIWGYIMIAFLISEKGYDYQENSTSNKKPITNLKAVTIGTPPEGGMDSIYEELDKLTIPELGCTLRFDFIPWGDEKKQINIATASGEYDFIPGGVFSDYRTLISKKAFLDLNSYLYLVPDLVKHYKSIQVDALKQCEIKGALYGLPEFTNVEIINIGAGFIYREDLRKEWGIKPITDINTMEAYLYRAKQEDRYRDEPLITDNRIWMALWDLLTRGKYLEVASAMETPFVVIEADNPRVPISRIDTPEFELVLSYIKKWYQDGIIASDMLLASDNEGTKGLNLMIEDKKPCETNVPIWSCTDSYIPELYKVNPNWEFGYFDYRLNTARLYMGSLVKNSVISVSAKTSSPEAAVKLLEKLHTDRRYYNLLHYGVEGEHFELNEDAISYDAIEASNYFSGWTAAVDDTLNYKEISVDPRWQQNVVDAYEAESNSRVSEAERNILIGFSLNTTSVLKEINKMEVVKKDIFQPIVCGIVEDDAKELTLLREELDAAGFEQYLNNIQKQLAQYIYYLN